jgi:hypothetical protein
MLHSTASPRTAACRLLLLHVVEVMLFGGVSACGIPRKDEPPPPDSVWMFFLSENTVRYPRMAPHADSEAPPGIVPQFYDAENGVAICGTYKRSRGPFIPPGYRDDEMVGYVRTADEVSGLAPFHDRQPGVWVRFTLLGTRADDARVRAIMERSDARIRCDCCHDELCRTSHSHP